MAYRIDEDLEFLGQLSDKELAPLVDILTKDKDGDSRWTEELTSSNLYKQYAPQHSKYWKEIAAEIQLFGGNTVANIARGMRKESAVPSIVSGLIPGIRVLEAFSTAKRQGVLYREVLIDVAEKLKVNFNKNSSIERIEQGLLLKLFEEMTEKMSSEQLQQLIQTLKLPVTTFTSEAITASFLTIFKAGGFKSYQLSLTIANTIMRLLLGRGLAIGTNAMLTRALSILAGPIGLTVMGALTLLDIASPAFRVTVPAVVCVAALRAEWMANQQRTDEPKDESLTSPIIKLNI